MKSLPYFLTLTLLLGVSPLTAMEPIAEVQSVTAKQNLLTPTDVSDSSLQEKLHISKINETKETDKNPRPKSLRNPGIGLLTSDLWTYALSYIEDPGAIFCSHPILLHSVFNNVRSLGSRNFTNNFLSEYAAQFKKLTLLDLSFNQEITDLPSLPNLTSLSLRACPGITDQLLLSVPNLTSLNLLGNSQITDAGVSSLTKLKHLNLTNNDNITGAALRNLPDLTSLDLGGRNNINDDDIFHLTKLKVLNLFLNSKISREKCSHIPAVVSISTF